MVKWRLRLIWAAVAAMITVWGVQAYMTGLRATEPVVVSTREISPRTEITADMLAVIQVSRTDRAQLARDSFQSKDEVVGRFARRRIEPGEVLRNRPSEITAAGAALPAGPDGELPLSEALPPDTRAVSLRLDQQAVLGRQIRAGDRVDLIFTSKSDATGGVYASTLLQQVTVLAIQPPPEDETDAEVLVTLLVTAAQAVDLSLAKRTGTIDLALNPPDPGDAIQQLTTSPLQFIHGGAAPVKSGAAQNPAPQTGAEKPPGR